MPTQRSGFKQPQKNRLMKNNSAKKNSGKTNSPAPVDTVTSRVETPPPELKILAQMKNLTPLQQVALLMPKFDEDLKSEKATEASETMAGFLWGIGLDLGVMLPEWVKAASEKFWKGLGLDFLGELKTPTPNAIGKIMEFMSLGTNNEIPSPLNEDFQKIGEYIKTESGHLPIDELKQFVDGRISAPKIIEKAKNPSERHLAFLNIACDWRAVEKLGSRTKTYQWLKEKKVISPLTEWGEVKNWLTEINLPKGKAGAPKKNRGNAKI